MAKKKAEEWTLKEYQAEYEALLQERNEWEVEARKISSYILPGRGVFNNLSRPSKRKLTSTKVVNPVAKDALRVLTSGLQGGLTSPSRPWFKFAFSDTRLNSHPVLSRWLYDAEKQVYAELAQSNFYQSIHSFYTEYAGFGTAAMYVGDDESAVRFDLLTFGEYAIGTDSKGRTDRFYRVIFRTGQMLIDDYEDKLPQSFLSKRGSQGHLHQWFTCLEATTPRKHQDKPYTKVLYLLGVSPDKASKDDSGDSGILLERNGYYEFCYPTARWDIIGSDVYGIGPGAEALPDVMRLQEMEKSASMAVHKSVNPPLFVPAHLRSKIKTLPGGLNYSRNTMNEKVSTLYDTRFDYPGVLAFVDRVVDRIKLSFFNDIFLTSSRDPNASPLKARQVAKIEEEGMFRLGPVIERLHYEFLQPLLERVFNIKLRRGDFMQLDPQTQALIDGSDFDIVLVSALAQSQKAFGIKPIQDFMQFVAGVASVDQSALDKIDIDASIDEFADITGVPAVIMRDAKAVQGIRDQRAQAMAKQKAQQEQLMAQAAQGQALESRANTAKTMSEAGINISEVLGDANGLQ
jgi:hypothetical protein